MNIYKLTLIDRWGAPFVVTVPAASLYQQTTYQQPQTSGGWKAGSF